MAELVRVASLFPPDNLQKYPKSGKTRGLFLIRISAKIVARFNINSPTHESHKSGK